MLPRLSPPTIPPTGTPSSNNADKHSAAGGDDLVTGDGDRVDSADSHGDAANKEENTSTTTAEVLNEASGNHVGDAPGNFGGIARRGAAGRRDPSACEADLHVHVPLLGREVLDAVEDVLQLGRLGGTRWMDDGREHLGGSALPQLPRRGYCLRVRHAAKHHDQGGQTWLNAPLPLLSMPSATLRVRGRSYLPPKVGPKMGNTHLKEASSSYSSNHAGTVKILYGFKVKQQIIIFNYFSSQFVGFPSSTYQTFKDRLVLFKNTIKSNIVCL